MVIALIAQIALWIWFLGCTATYRIGKHLLVEGVGLKSAEFFMLCLYSLGLIAFHCLQPAGKWILFGILVLWFIVQFMCHWYYTIFGASERKLLGYNDCFRDSIRIFPMSDKKLIPDLSCSPAGLSQPSRGVFITVPDRDPFPATIFQS